MKQTAIVTAFTTFMLYVFQHQENVQFSMDNLTIAYMLLNGISINKLLKVENLLDNLKHTRSNYNTVNTTSQGLE